MDHLEKSVQHELGGSNGLIFDQNVAWLLGFVKAWEDPLIVLAPKVQLYNFVTKQIVNDIIKVSLLQALMNGDAAYQKFCKSDMWTGPKS